MLSFLGFIFFFVLIIIFFGLTILSGILRALFGFGRRNSSSARSSSANEGKHTRENKKRNARNTPKRKKVFDDDEGEYVEFEEIKKDGDN